LKIGVAVKHFDRDPETNQVLWFSGPPIDVARTPVPQHSLKYLHYVATKRKEKRLQDRKEEEEEGREEFEQMDVDEDNSRPDKRRRIATKARMTDVFDDVWKRVSIG
jgi:chromatin structure-remodeling complex subunit RSC1/2